MYLYILNLSSNNINPLWSQTDPGMFMWSTRLKIQNWTCILVIEVCFSSQTKVYVIDGLKLEIFIEKLVDFEVSQSWTFIDLAGVELNIFDLPLIQQHNLF